jgi:histone-lysine N-methyltransferase SETMAR
MNASLKMMKEPLNINREMIRTILHEDLSKTKVCAKFVPHTLTDEQKSKRVDHFREVVAAARNDRNFLKSIVMGDETWCFQYDPETKRQSAEWKSKNLPQAKKTQKVPSKIKTMLITFFDSKGIIHKEFVPFGQTVTGNYYLEVLKRLMVRIRRIRPEYRDPESWSLLHDNAPSHNSLIVRRFLARNQVCVLNHPPYSPDLAPCDFSLFPKLKLELKGCFFEDIPTIQTALTLALEAIPKKELDHAFESLLNRCNKCIEARGDYFE